MYAREILLTLVTGVLGGFLLAIGAFLVFSGVNVPLGAGLMVAGAVALGTAATINWKFLNGDLSNALSILTAIVSGALLAMGALFAFTGVDVPLGIALMAAGAVGLATAIGLNWDSMSEPMRKAIGTLEAIVGGALLTFGAILALTGANIPLGIGMIAAGAVSLVSAIALNWGALTGDTKKSIGTITALVSGALIGIGASAAGKSYYALAEEILSDAGISEYYIDPRLKKLYSNNPIPRVKYKEALQIIANACRCVLTQSRDGKVQIKSNFMPSASVATNGEETYSNAANVLAETEKAEYATFAGNYTPVDGTMFFLPRDGKAALTTGYISKEISGADGKFTKNPVITATMEAIRAYYGLKLVFGTALPAAFTIRTYNGGELVNEYPVAEDEINTTSILLRDFDDFDVMKIEFTKTAEPYNRIVLNYFSLSDVVDFTMNRRDMTSSPKAIKQELIKEVIVYQENEFHDGMKVMVYRHTIKFNQAFGGKVTVRRVGG